MKTMPGEWLDGIADRARQSLDEANESRERALGISRELVRTAANSIRAVHRGDHPAALSLLERAGNLAGELGELAERRADLYFTGYVQDSLKEFAEARCVYAIVSGEAVPDAVEMNIPWPAYLNGLGETVGELRRHCLDLLRQGHVEQGVVVLESMDAIFSILVTIDYPDALTGGLRRTSDMARGILERTRADLTTAVIQRRLSEDMERLAGRLASLVNGPDDVRPAGR
ncbi:MAG: haloacid dehalogenase [Chloroflexi bacterium]|nr:haloacid dehalogenase [Chloroflexota bacterium]